MSGFPRKKIQLTVHICDRASHRENTSTVKYHSIASQTGACRILRQEALVGESRWRLRCLRWHPGSAPCGDWRRSGGPGVGVVRRPRGGEPGYGVDKDVFEAENGQDVAEAPSAEGIEDRHSEVKALFEAKVDQDVDEAPAAGELEESHSGQGLVRVDSGQEVDEAPFGRGARGEPIGGEALSQGGVRPGRR